MSDNSQKLPTRRGAEQKVEHDALRRDLDLSLSAEDWDVRSSGLGERPRTTTVRRRTVIARRLAMTVRRRTAIARRAP